MTFIFSSLVSILTRYHGLSLIHLSVMQEEPEHRRIRLSRMLYLYVYGASVCESIPKGTHKTRTQYVRATPKQQDAGYNHITTSKELHNLCWQSVALLLRLHCTCISTQIEDSFQSTPPYWHPSGPANSCVFGRLLWGKRRFLQKPPSAALPRKNRAMPKCQTYPKWVAWCRLPGL